MGYIVRNCRLCAKPMESSPFMMCTACLMESDRVKNYILKHPHVSIEQIAEATQIPFEKVFKMVELGLSKGNTRPNDKNKTQTAR
ncbi:hypothetical protein [Virgibacillus oceani]|uniref:Flagellar protein n=1 Tax=Virgibacillus oceani TaxID=1479511 RepID=A0A917M900_9BACI|nr:hypothetical protein [Virgibacillus oceani]GGG85366.1 hypothetical protein GCM10011398_33870 [Virgibacillus oceani]